MNLHIRSRLSSLYDRVFHLDHGQGLRRAREPPSAKNTDAALVDGVTVTDEADVYGVRIPAASDRARIDDGASDSGENWVDTLEMKAVETGLEPEQELDLGDLEEDEITSPHRITRDAPLADRGVGGPRGR